jgi:hypothetical protein
MLERLDAFREEAELRTPVPAFEVIEQRGRSRRRRRRAVIGAVAASVIVVTGLLATTGGQPPESRTANPTTPDVTPYPQWMRMVTLPSGTYAMQPFADPAAPVVHVEVPPRWNAWEGPNRFEGLRPAGEDNSEALGETHWLVGLVAVEVRQIATPACGTTDMAGRGADALVRALTAIPRLQLSEEPERTQRFGHVATHLSFEDTGMTPACPRSLLFETARNGEMFFVTGQRNVYHAWVVETDFGPLLIWYVWTKDAPPHEIEALQAMVESLEVVDRK